MEKSSKRSQQETIGPGEMDDAAGRRGPLLEGVEEVVMDIEGTTTPIAYVKSIVFPFLRANVRAYLEADYESAETQADIDALRQFAEGDPNFKADPIPPANQDAGDKESRSRVIDAAVSLVERLMDADSKAGPLKQLQGHVWREAVKGGKRIEGGVDVYDDVVLALPRLTALGLKLSIYSSGSVEAQRLLFGHSSHGDLLQWFSAHFDTAVGAKADASSYANIAASLKQQQHPAHILFLTDIPAEARGARTAGLKAVLVVREGNAPLTDLDIAEFSVIHSFDELFLAPASSL